MFKLDLFLLKNIYSLCKQMGKGLGFGAIEGFWTYFIIIAGSITSVLSRKFKW